MKTAPLVVLIIFCFSVAAGQITPSAADSAFNPRHYFGCPPVQTIAWVVKTAAKPAVPLCYKRDIAWSYDGVPIQFLNRNKINEISAEIVDSAQWGAACDPELFLPGKWIVILEFMVDTLSGFKWTQGEVTQEQLMRHPQVCRISWLIMRTDGETVGLYRWSKARGIEAWDEPQLVRLTPK